MPRTENVITYLDLPNPGEVYIIDHPEMPHMVKIGGTERLSEQRISEMESSAGLPGQYRIIAAVRCTDWLALERHLHRHFEKARRPNSEWFYVDPVSAAEEATKHGEARLIDKEVLRAITNAPGYRFRQHLKKYEWYYKWPPFCALSTALFAFVAIVYGSEKLWLPSIFVIGVSAYLHKGSGIAKFVGCVGVFLITFILGAFSSAIIANL